MAKPAVSVLAGLLSLAAVAAADPDPARSPFNGWTLEEPAGSDGYAFWVAGHLYGQAGGGSRSTFPAASLLGNLERFNQSGAAFFVSLGDIWRHADARHLENFQTSFADRLAMPLFNAAGNHELEDRALYEGRYGDTFTHFDYGGDCFILLDSERDGGRIAGGQLNMLREELEEAGLDPAIRNIFVFSHKLIWARKPLFQVVFEHLNSQEGYVPPGAFERDVEPLLAKTAASKPIYFFSGDVGASWSLPLFIDTDVQTDITYIAVGLGDTERDAAVRVSVDDRGRVSIEAVSLAGQTVTWEDYGLEDWRRYFEALQPSFWSRLNSMWRKDRI